RRRCPRRNSSKHRFHNIKNLTSYAQDYLKKNLRKNIRVVVGCDISVGNNLEVPFNINNSISDNRKLTLEEKYCRSLEFMVSGLLKQKFAKSSKWILECLILQR
ncbi:MAG: hypothetical protein LBD23_15790, partial [Oscillospiraceae bacterium]|nr:hypothetical protein [Oscillospiraceae bacterium]